MRASSFLLALFALGACDAEPPADSGPIARPVTVFRLSKQRPALPGRVTGVAVPYREEQIGFEVGGRVVWVRDVGAEVRGTTENAAGSVLEEGEELARLDSTRAQQALHAAELALESDRRTLDVQELELKTSLPTQLEQARAQETVALEDLNSAQSSATFAESELERRKGLLEQGLSTQAEFERAQRDVETARATLESARARRRSAGSQVVAAENNVRIQEAQVQRMRAVVDERLQSVERARTDFEDTTLHAPFSGRITRRHLGRGALVQPGAPAVTLTMMDPIKVVVTTSAQNSRALLAGTRATVVPSGLENFTDEDVLEGVVLRKAEVADPDTRTFQVEILVRNVARRQRIVTADGHGAAPIDQLFPVIGRDASPEGPMFLHPDCVREEDGRRVVYRLPGLQVGRARRHDLEGLLHPEVVPVDLQDEFFTLNMTLQRIAEPSPLHLGDLLIRRPRPEQREGAVLGSGDWAVRPGDLVPVELDLGQGEPGFYVPAEAVTTRENETSVYVIDAEDRAHGVPVTIHERIGALCRIEAAALAEGTAIVLEGVHYVADGELVRRVDALGR